MRIFKSFSLFLEVNRNIYINLVFDIINGSYLKLFELRLILKCAQTYLANSNAVKIYLFIHTYVGICLA